MIDLKPKNLRLLSMPDLDYEIPWGFFDGASQGHPPYCGVGVVLFVSQNHFIHIRYSPDRGTNNRAELIALWTLLEAASKKGTGIKKTAGDG